MLLIFGIKKSRSRRELFSHVNGHWTKQVNCLFVQIKRKISYLIQFAFQPADIDLLLPYHPVNIIKDQRNENHRYQ